MSLRLNRPQLACFLVNSDAAATLRVDRLRCALAPSRLADLP